MDRQKTKFLKQKKISVVLVDFLNKPIEVTWQIHVI